MEEQIENEVLLVNDSTGENRVARACAWDSENDVAFYSIDGDGMRYTRDTLPIEYSIREVLSHVHPNVVKASRIV